MGRWVGDRQILDLIGGVHLTTQFVSIISVFMYSKFLLGEFNVPPFFF